MTMGTLSPLFSLSLVPYTGIINLAAAAAAATQQKSIKMKNNEEKRQKVNGPREGNNNNNTRKRNNQQNNNKNKNNQGPSRKLSHHLSWALRHAAPELHLTMTPDGYVPVQEILQHSHAKFQGVAIEHIRQIVETSDKQRFKLEERPARDYYPDSKDDASAMILCIRANQGHTIKTIDANLLLTKLSREELQEIPVIVHGTYKDPYETCIVSQGLKRMQRTHIHFASGLPQEDGVISGMRKSCQIYIYINAAKCAADDVPFYKSDNGVLLTAGVEEKGTLPPEYVSHVTDSSGNILLDQRSQRSSGAKEESDFLII
jgi:2'-phosphotransferase